MRDTIAVIGARENNLKNVHVEIPREQFVVLTGMSGSGKSSLAFETIYAEGQRRFLESLSAYSRRYVSQLKKPDVDFIYGLSPVISIKQKFVNRNPRSTVGTMTDIFDYLRTTGLHLADIQRLLDSLTRLVDAGNSVLVIEHQLDVIKCADWVIDLGPEGGNKGGRVVAQGTPEQLAACEESYTGHYLRDALSLLRVEAAT